MGVNDGLSIAVGQLRNRSGGRITGGGSEALPVVSYAEQIAKGADAVQERYGGGQGEQQAQEQVVREQSGQEPVQEQDAQEPEQG